MDTASWPWIPAPEAQGKGTLCGPNRFLSTTLSLDLGRIWAFHSRSAGRGSALHSHLHIRWTTGKGLLGRGLCLHVCPPALQLARPCTVLLTPAEDSTSPVGCPPVPQPASALRSLRRFRAPLALPSCQPFASVPVPSPCFNLPVGSPNLPGH